MTTGQGQRLTASQTQHALPGHNHPDGHRVRDTQPKLAVGV